jgi:hypothetical protein
VQEPVLEYLMRGFDTPLLLSGLNEQQAEDTAESRKRFVTAALMAAAALLLCAVIVVILAPILPHPATVSHGAGLSLAPSATHASL